MSDNAIPRPVARVLALPALVAAAVILTHFGGSHLFLTRHSCWLGAGILAGFTVPASLANPFWAFEGPERRHRNVTFFEHAATVGGFAMAALFASGRRPHS